MKILFVIHFMWLSLTMMGQPTVKVEVSADTITAGQVVEISYTIENGQGDFQVPDLSGLPLISGPNTSSNFVYQNGKMNSSQSYSFHFRPMEEGRFVIPGTVYISGNEEIDIQPVEIFVVKDQGRVVPPKTYGPAHPTKPAREKRKF